MYYHLIIATGCKKFQKQIIRRGKLVHKIVNKKVNHNHQEKEGYESKNFIQHEIKQKIIRSTISSYRTLENSRTML